MDEADNDVRTKDEPKAILFVLDPEGSETVPSRGWRGHVLGISPESTTISAAVTAARCELGPDVELHSLIYAPEGKWIVLRATTRYLRAGE